MCCTSRRSHPIGLAHRKGKNNTLGAGADQPGSPYAIGSPDGGHDAVHPELGTLDDFRALVAAAADHGLEIALDFAIQCSPDHPWLKEHPGWFSWRPDGSMRYAENPPKKYQDIVTSTSMPRRMIPGALATPARLFGPSWGCLWEPHGFRGSKQGLSSLFGIAKANEKVLGWKTRRS